MDYRDRYFFNGPEYHWSDNLGDDDQRSISKNRDWLRSTRRRTHHVVRRLRVAASELGIRTVRP